MKRQALAITLLEDCVFSQRAATEGGHASLDYVPGQTLLGAAAAQLYPHMDRPSAFTAFHSGRLRFGNGLPSNGATVAFPMPYSWHEAKSEPARWEGHLDGDKVFDFLHMEDLPDGRQPKQLRTGYVFLDGRVVSPARDLRLKTAIEPDTGRAAEGQLFGYESLTRGQRFLAQIEADDVVEDALFEKVVHALSGEVRLGRSRSAEYGRARIEPVGPIPLDDGPAPDSKLTLWLLSDLALVDNYGQPTLEPDPEYLGLGHGEIVWDKTFLRSRRYSVWNAYRHGFDRERLVLCAGGVVRLQLDTTPAPDALVRLARGVGQLREAGLGRVYVNAPILQSRHPDFRALVADTPLPEPVRPADPLIDWLEGISGDSKTGTDERATELAGRYQNQLDSARRAAGVSAEQDFGPSKSQWGRVLEAARTATGQDLHNELFVSDSAIVKAKAKGWDVECVGQDERWQRMAEWLKAELEPDLGRRSAGQYAHLVRQLAHRVRDRVKER